jgi:hypothetical protein
MSSEITGISNFMDGMLSSRSRFGGTFDRCPLASRSNDVDAIDISGRSLGLTAFNDGKGEEGEVLGGEGGR